MYLRNLWKIRGWENDIMPEKVPNLAESYLIHEQLQYAILRGKCI